MGRGACECEPGVLLLLGWVQDGSLEFCGLTLYQ